MIVYLIKSTLCLSAFLLVYYFLFERENMPVFKRFYLLGSLIFSYLIPFVAFEFQAENTVVAVSQNLQTIILPAIEINAEKNYSNTILLSIYGIVTFIFFSRFIWNLLNIQKVKRNAEITNFQSAKLALVDAPILPHTFGSTIFVNKQSYLNRTIEAEIFTHELTHVREKHTLDIIFVELLKTAFWFNPLLILYKRAIQLNHEFLADQKVVSSSKNAALYQKLLLRQGNPHTTFYLTSNLNSFLKTKKRFIMMTKTTSTRTQLLKKTIVAPIFIGLFILGSSITFAQDYSQNKPEEKSKEIIAADKKLYEEYLKNYEEYKSDPKKLIQHFEETIYQAEDKKPDFPGGMMKFYEFVGHNFKAPEEKISGKVYVKFIVETDGSLSNFKILRDIGYGTGEEAVRVLKLSPKWIPAEKDGKKVAAEFSLPITIHGN